jgi:hypothetical protein
MLRQLGVRNVQGHLLLPPAPAAELGALARGRHLALRHDTGPAVAAGTVLRSA